MLEKAINIAIKAHLSQKDKAGNPYILHLLAVMEKGKNEDEKIVGVLHDLVEDTDWTLERLAQEGFENHIVNSIDCLTKRQGETYENFILRVKSNRLATQVKIYDLENNMDIRRLAEITMKDVERLNKYLKIYRELTAIV